MNNNYINIVVLQIRQILLLLVVYVLERISLECCKTKTKIVTLANKKRGDKLLSKPIKTRSNYRYT